MVKVVGKATYNVICKKCNLKLEFGRKDIKEHQLKAGAVVVDIDYYIECPECNNRVVVAEAASV